MPSTLYWHWADFYRKIVRFKSVKGLGFLESGEWEEEGSWVRITIFNEKEIGITSLGEGSLRKTPFCWGGMEIFWNYTIYVVCTIKLHVFIWKGVFIQFLGCIVSLCSRTELVIARVKWYVTSDLHIIGNKGNTECFDIWLLNGWKLLALEKEKCIFIFIYIFYIFFFILLHFSSDCLTLEKSYF